MGKRIRVQRRGRGSKTFQAATHKRIAPARYPSLQKEKRSTVITGQIQQLVHDPGRGSPLALIKLDDGETYYSIVPEGVYEGQDVEVGSEASVRIGNVVPVGKLPEGTTVCNIELSPGDGGKLVRSSGSFATIVSHTPDGTVLRMPSGKNIYVNDLCLATVGVVSGAGRVEKPFLKAGAKYYYMKAKGHKYPRTRGRAMIAAVHPYGGGRRGGRKVTTVSHRTPPGRKVGLIAARRAGQKKK